MECLIQYLDDIEDAVFALALAGERVRRALRNLLLFGALFLLQGLGLLLALRHPPLALAALALLAVAYLYHNTVAPPAAASRG